MNANHARPMLAFWVLAAAAALITGLGLRGSDSAVTVRAGSPSPVSRSGSPELVLGGLLSAVPGAQPTATSRVGALSAAAIEYAARQAAAATPSASADHGAVSAPTARKKNSTPSSVHTRTTTTASASATVSAAPRPGRGHHHGSGSGSGSGPTTTTATATTSTSPGKGHQGTPGQGSGGPGKSSAH